jgi:hypothetical protein
MCWYIPVRIFLASCYNFSSSQPGYQFGVDRIERWMLGTSSLKSDRFFTPTVRDRLFETKLGNGFDLNALNIQRGRDHGIPG